VNRYDRHAPCVKCGNTCAREKWHGSSVERSTWETLPNPNRFLGWLGFKVMGPVTLHMSDPYIERECCCGYRWREEPLDWVDEEESSCEIMPDGSKSCE
jgi:hypothetical protein